MRHIHALAPEKVPRDDEYKFRERAKALVDKWHDVLSASKANGNGDSTVRKPAANGKAHSEESGAKGANGKEASPSQEPTAKPEGDSMEVDSKEKDSTSPAAAEADAPAEAEDTTADAAADDAAEEAKGEDVAMEDAA